ncbi:hypothetical protein [Yoonia sp. BS5-3]|uniref:Uncharacterized protein n=1 Tax=Yoonia phaeophyticola TaxID=3137369 RepID=A0ABZ2V2E7_9RHOB
MTPTHASKSGAKIHYYISNRLIKVKDPTGWRLPAKTLEPLICSIIAKHLSDCAKNARLIDAIDVHEVEMIPDRVAKTFDYEDAAQPAVLKRFADVLKRGACAEDQPILTLDRAMLASTLNVEPTRIRNDALRSCSSLTLRKRGVETKIIAGDYATMPDRKLQMALAKAHVWVSKLKQGRTISQIAQDENGSEGPIRKRIRLAFLSPEIQKVILTGAQPQDLTLARILRSKPTANWGEQETLLGL